MVTPPKKRLLLLITNSYAATNIIHSGLIKPLAEKYALFLISDHIKKYELTVINQHFCIQIQPVHFHIGPENKGIKLLRQLEKVLFFDYFNIETQKIKNQQLPFFHLILFKGILYLLSKASLSKGILQLLRKTIIRLTRENSAFSNSYLSTYDGIISTSPLDIRENAIVNSLSHIPSLAMIISWDNLTSKGVINANHDRMLVWNQFMAEEYNLFYQMFGISAQTIHITGIPRFDIYSQPLPQIFTSDKLRIQLNIPVQDKIIFFATSAATHFPNQADIVEHLLEYATERKSTTLVLRCHPGDDPRHYEKFSKKPCHRIWSSVNISPSKKSIPALDSLENLAAMLRECDVCVQVASTIRLEAALCNKPCVSIAYDGDNNSLPDYHSVKRFYAYSHQLPLNKLNLDQPVFSKAELFQTLDDIFERPVPIEHSSRIKNFVHQTDAKSISTTMQTIEEWLN